MKEIWKRVDIHNDYMVSNTGKLRNKNGKLLTGGVNKWGYYNHIIRVNNKKKNFKRHRLIAQAFISNPENKPCVNHKDSNRLNNAVDNLEWVTYKENTHHSMDSGFFWKSTKANMERSVNLRRLSDLDVRLCIKWRELGFSYLKIGKAFGVSCYTIRKLVNRGGYKKIH